MTSRNRTSGGKFASEQHDSAQLGCITLNNLHDLLRALDTDVHIRMLTTTAGHLSKLLKKSVEEIGIESLIDLDDDFRKFLRSRHYSRSSVRSYIYFMRLLLRRAKKLGWQAPQVKLPPEWESVSMALKPGLHITSIVRFAIRLGKTPSQFSDECLNEWGAHLIAQGRSYEYVRRVKNDFRLAVREGGLGKLFPALRTRSRQEFTYRIPLIAFPEALQADVVHLLTWKQALYSPRRPKHGRHRAVSAKHLERRICELYGYAVSTGRAEGIRQLPDLVSARIVEPFVEWCLNERRQMGDGVVGTIGMLRAAMRHCPRFADCNFDWMGDLIATILRSTDTDLLARKASKYVPYQTLADIPDRMHNQRERYGDEQRGTSLANP